MTVVASAYVLAAALAAGSAGASEAPDPAELACLALNVYHESRGQPLEGQSAVAHVTLNRVRSNLYPESVCGVVTHGVGRSCQFHWYCDGKPDAPRDEDAFNESPRVAVDALTGRSPDPTKGATSFTSTRIATPDWARRMTRTATIGGHHFYRR